MGQSSSVSIVAKQNGTWKNEYRTRRLRYKRFVEDADWSSNPPDGSDIEHDNFKSSYITRELLDTCKAHPKHLFSECQTYKKICSVEEPEQNVLQRIRRANAERERIKAVKKQSDMLAKLESKWLKEFKEDKQKSETLSGGIGILGPPKWFTNFRRDAKGVVEFSDLVQSPFPDTTNNTIENLRSKKLKLVLKQKKTDDGVFFKLIEKVSEGKSFRTNVIFDDVVSTKANTNHVCLSGECRLKGEHVTIDLMIINTNIAHSNSNLRGIYVRQLENDPHILTWIAKSK